MKDQIDDNSTTREIVEKSSEENRVDEKYRKIRRALTKNDERLECYLNVFKDKFDADVESVSDAKLEVNRLLEAGEIDRETLLFISTQDVFGVFENGNVAQKPMPHPVYAAFIYNTYAERALNAGIIDDTWLDIVEASYYVGSAESIKTFEHYKKKLNETRTQQSVATVSRDTKLVPVKRMAAQLLHAAPQGGWKSKNAAITAIIKEVSQYISDHKIKLSPLVTDDSNTLKRWLLKWVMVDVAMYDALHENLSKTSKSKIKSDGI